MAVDRAMKPVTMYQANDGMRFNTEHEALARDALIAECDAEMAKLGIRKPPEDIGFTNGSGYIQQPIGSRGALEAFLRAKGTNRDSDGPIGRLLYRLHCMDERDREWAQPFFALNPPTNAMEVAR